MTTLTFDIPLFRQQFPQFASETTYPDALLQMYWDMAVCYISDQDYGFLSGSCRQLAINLMVAHLTVLSQLDAEGDIVGGSLEQSATVDKVSVSLTPPPNKSQYSWWLSQTPYGQQLQALLSSKIAGGFYAGGLPERSAFRKVGGIF